MATSDCALERSLFTASVCTVYIMDNLQLGIPALKTKDYVRHADNYKTAACIV